MKWDRAQAKWSQWMGSQAPDAQPMEIDRVEGKGGWNKGKGQKGKGKSNKGFQKGKGKGGNKGKSKSVNNMEENNQQNLKPKPDTSS